MTDERYTDEEILKALKHCAGKDTLCGECPLFKGIDICCSVSKLALDLVNRQESEIERLKKEVSVARDAYISIQDRYEHTKTEAYKTFAEMQL